MYPRRGVLAAGALSPLAPDAAAAVNPTDRARRGKPPLVTFASTADVFNGDVGDLTGLPRWDGGPNSVNTSWTTAIDHCLRAVAVHRPTALLLAGDLVEGRWNLDTTGRALFGPVSELSDPASLAACRRAITAAGGVYYGFHAAAFARHGLRVLPAVGDHEILDDRPAPHLNRRWPADGRVGHGPRRGEPDNRWALVPHAKSTWADHFTTTSTGRPRFADRPRGAAARTAYAVDLGRALRIITVDVFTRTPDGVRLGVFDRQLLWLRRTIRAAKRQGRVVVVQGHVPILQPFRSLATGNLRIPEAHRSALYRVLDEEGADFYFSGEVHDTTVQQRRRGPVQISHGSIFRYAFNFLVGKVYRDRTTVLDYYELTVERASAERALWSTDQSKWQRTLLEYGPPVHRGRIEVRDRRIVSRTGKLAVYHPTTDTLGYAGNLDPELL